MAEKTVDPKDKKCPYRGCKFGKEPWQIFCWAHWFKLTEDHRRRLNMAKMELQDKKTDRAKQVMAAYMKEAKSWLKKELKPLNK